MSPSQPHRPQLCTPLTLEISVMIREARRGPWQVAGAQYMQAFFSLCTHAILGIQTKLAAITHITQMRKHEAVKALTQLLHQRRGDRVSVQNLQPVWRSLFRSLGVRREPRCQGKETAARGTQMISGLGTSWSRQTSYHKLLRCWGFVEVLIYT